MTALSGGAGQPESISARSRGERIFKAERFVLCYHSAQGRPTDVSHLSYCDDLLHYERRLSREVMVGQVGVGGDNPIRVQSMITCDTMDTEASIATDASNWPRSGCEIVRITAPTVKDAANLQHIVRGLRERGCDVPIVADIHFKPEAAMEAAKWVDKVRINPGNYADSKKFKIIEYTDEQYAAELTDSRTLYAAGGALQATRHRDAHRDQPRFALRSDHEPLRRYAPRDGGKRARVRPYRARSSIITPSSSR